MQSNLSFVSLRAVRRLETGDWSQLVAPFAGQQRVPPVPWPKTKRGGQVPASVEVHPFCMEIDLAIGKLGGGVRGLGWLSQARAIGLAECYICSKWSRCQGLTVVLQAASKHNRKKKKKKRHTVDRESVANNTAARKDSRLQKGLANGCRRGRDSHPPPVMPAQNGRAELSKRCMTR